MKDKCLLLLNQLKPYLYKVLDGHRNGTMVNSDALWKSYNKPICHFRQCLPFTSVGVVKHITCESIIFATFSTEVQCHVMLRNMPSD